MRIMRRRRKNAIAVVVVVVVVVIGMIAEELVPCPPRDRMEALDCLEAFPWTRPSSLCPRNRIHQHYYDDDDDGYCYYSA